MIELALAAAISGAAAPVFDAGPPVFGDAPPLSDAVLAQHRGGFRLPNGIDVNLTVQTITAVDGAVVLKTVVTIDEGRPRVQTLVPVAGQTVSSANTRSNATNTPMPVVSYDPTGGLRISRRESPFPITFSSHANGEMFEATDGLRSIDPATPVDTHNGIVRELSGSKLFGIELASHDLRIVHLTGDAFGSAVINTADNRAIDTQTILSIDLRNAGPDVLGSTLFRVENLALDALSTRY